MRRTLLIACCLLSGCTYVRDSGVRWYNPGTWFSASEIRDAKKADAKAEDAGEKVDLTKWQAVHGAHVEIAKAGLSVDAAPPSREVELGRRFTFNGLGLLDQVDPLTASEVSDMRKLVNNLLSENAQIRADADKDQAKLEGRLDETSKALSQAQVERAAALKLQAKEHQDLLAGSERENALANELRNSKWWSWFWRISIGAVALLLLAGWVYAKATLGGLPAVVTRMQAGAAETLKALEAHGPAVVATARNALDAALHTAEQSGVAQALFKLTQK
jgi:regulator of replication initiation timing